MPTYLDEEIHVLLLGLLRRLALLSVPAVPVTCYFLEYLPLGATGEVQHTRTRGRHVALGGLLVQTVDLDLLSLRHLSRAVLGQTTDNLHCLLELSVAHAVRKWTPIVAAQPHETRAQRALFATLGLVTWTNQKPSCGGVEPL